MPTNDWQFWVVSAVALVALWRVARLVVRMVRPWFRRGKPSTTRASLTISAKSVHKP